MKLDDIIFFCNHKYGEVCYLVEDEKEILLLTSKNKWKIIKADFSRFHRWFLYHSNYPVREGYHRQSSNVNLDFLIFDAIRHDTPQMEYISWEKFKYLWDMYCYGREIESSIAAFNFLCED